jgi:prefoldin subunit 5
MKDPTHENERLTYWLGRYTDLTQRESYNVEKELTRMVNEAASFINLQVNADTSEEEAADLINRALDNAADAIRQAKQRLAEFDRECTEVEEEIKQLAGESRSVFVNSLVKQRKAKMVTISRSLANVTSEIERLEGQLRELEADQTAIDEKCNG